MTLFRTFCIEALRLWDYLWWFFTGSLWVARAVRAPIGPPITSPFSPLTDDCLFLLLKHFSVSELFTLRAVCRTLCHHIERYHFPSCKTFLTRHDQTSQRYLPFSQVTMQVTLDTAQHLYSDYCRQRGFPHHEQTYLPTLQWPLLTRPHATAWLAFPLSLPLLLPHLSCLTWTHCLADSELRANNPSWAVNRLFLAYLSSSWSTSLLSLHLHIEMVNKPQVNLVYFQQLNQLINLKHLFLEFSKFLPSSVFLPDHMPIFGQLTSFSLHNYGNSNTGKLLSQLGPNLTFLSLIKVGCPLEDLVAFLHGRPTYGRTLQIVELWLYTIYDWTLFTTITECLTSLERIFCFLTSGKEDLVTLFSYLNRLSHLREISNVLLYVEQLRDLRRLGPCALPRLSSIHSATIAIIKPNSIETLQPEELFDNLLPLLPDVFCGLKQLTISLQNQSLRRDPLSPPLTEQLSARTRQLFPGLSQCKAFYYTQ